LYAQVYSLVLLLLVHAVLFDRGNVIIVSYASQDITNTRRDGHQGKWRTLRLWKVLSQMAKL